MCDLCNMVQRIADGTINETVLYDDQDFVVVYCNNPEHPQTPMCVSKYHQAAISPEKAQAASDIMSQLYPRRRPRGMGTLTIKNHWHEHWI